MAGRKIAFALLLLALAPSLATAAVFDRTFTHDYSGWQNAYVHTDIETSPSLALPGGKTVYCVGDTFSPTIGMQSDWYSSVYDAQLANQNNFGGCLVASCTPHSNNALNWVTGSQYTALSSPVWYTTVAAFNQMISNNGIPNNMPGECSKYLTSTYQPYNVGGNTLFKSDIGAYCKGTLSLSSSNSAYGRTIAQEYTGTIPAISPPIILNSASPSVTFTTSMSTTGCIASGRTYATSSCAEGVWLYYSAASGFPLSAQSPTVTITVKNPFTCSAVQVTSPSLTPTTNVQPGQQMSFSFVMTNPTSNGESVKLTNVSASWPYSQPVVNGGLPQTFANNGVPYTISGTLAAPSAPGTYNFNLTVNYSSSVADCSGSVKNCFASFPFTVTVQQNTPPNPPTSCTLAFAAGHNADFTAPDSATVVATCRNSTNAVLPCGFLAWSTTANGGSVTPASTTTPPQASQTLFSINAVRAPQSAQVKAQQASNFSCTIALNIIAPDYIPILSAPSQVQVNSQFTATVTTKNIGAAANISTYTKLQFRTLTQNFMIAPLGQQGTQDSSFNFTCPSTPGPYELNATVDYTNLLTESNENNNFATQMVNCTAAPPILKPNYVPNISASTVAFIGQAFSVNFTTKNIGQAAATVTSTTRATFQSTVKDFTVAPLAVQQQQTDSWSFTCASAGVKNLVETVDYTGVINESSETDNNQTKPISCYTAPTSCTLNFTGPDFPPFNAFASSGVLASCFAGGAQTACPPFLWQQNANGGSMSPTSTPASFAPSSTLTLVNAPVPQLGRKVNATSTLPGIPLYCEIIFVVSGGAAVGPDYTVTSIQPSPAPADIGQTVHFTTTVANIGNVNATNDSTSVATYSAGCTPVKSSYFLPHIDAGASHTDTSLACICNAAGAQTITVEANPAPHPQYETTYANNIKTITFICNGPAAPLTCAYFV